LDRRKLFPIVRLRTGDVVQLTPFQYALRLKCSAQSGLSKLNGDPAIEQIGQLDCPSGQDGVAFAYRVLLARNPGKVSASISLVGSDGQPMSRYRLNSDY
jgi:hypothetical protein